MLSNLFCYNTNFIKKLNSPFLLVFIIFTDFIATNGMIQLFKAESSDKKIKDLIESQEFLKNFEILKLTKNYSVEVRTTKFGAEILETLDAKIASANNILNKCFKISRTIPILIDLEDFRFLSNVVEDACIELNKDFSSTEKQRAISYIPTLANLTHNVDSASRLALEIVDCQHRKDDIYRKQNINEMPQIRIKINNCIENVLVICRSDYSIEERIIQLYHANRINMEGKFGRKYSKTVRILNGFYCNADGGFKNNVRNIEPEEVGIEFLKDISSSPESYRKYLSFISKAGYATAGKYLEDEMQESCFYETERNGTTRYNKRLSHKPLTQWQQVDQNLVLSHPENIKFILQRSDCDQSEFKEYIAYRNNPNLGSLEYYNSENLVPGIFTDEETAKKSFESKLSKATSNAIFSIAKSIHEKSKLSGDDLFTHKGVTYNLKDAIIVNNPDGTFTFYSTLDDQERKKLEEMFWHCDEKQLKEISQKVPAVRKLDSYKLKTSTVDQFIDNYQNIEGVQSYFKVNDFIKHVIKQANPFQCQQLAKILNDEHLAFNFKDLEDRLDPNHINFIPFENRLLKIAQNSSLVKKLNEEDRDYLFSRKEEIETNQKICDFVEQLNTSLADAKTMVNAKNVAYILQIAKENPNLKSRLAANDLYGSLHYKAIEIATEVMPNVLATYEKSAKDEQAQKKLLKHFGVIDDIASLTFKPACIVANKEYQALKSNANSAIANNSGFNIDELSNLSDQLNVPRKELYQVHSSNGALDLFKETVNGLKELASGIIDIDAVQDLKQLGIASLKFLRKGKEDLAELSCAIMDIGIGMVKEGVRQGIGIAQEFASYKGLQMLAKNRGVQFAAAAASAALSSSHAGLLIRFGQLAWTMASAGNVVGHIVDDWNKINDAFDKGNYQELGSALVKGGMDALTGKRMAQSIIGLSKFSDGVAPISKNKKQQYKERGQQRGAHYRTPEGDADKLLFKNGILQLKTRFGTKNVNLAKSLLFDKNGERDPMRMPRESLERIEAVAEGLSEIRTNPNKILNALGFDMASQEAKVIADAYAVLHNTPNILEENCAFARVFKSIGRNNDLDRGAFYEIKAALRFNQLGEQITQLGKQLASSFISRDFDIITASGLHIECKNWDWSLVNIIKCQDKFKDQLRIVTEKRGTFGVSSATPIPDSWKKWFTDNGIQFFEG